MAAYGLVTDIGAQREAVFQRDRGVCGICGVDTLQLRATYLRVCTVALNGASWDPEAPQIREFAERLKNLGFDPHRKSFWDMDHIIPVADDGGIELGVPLEAVLANLRTLCIACHKRITRQWRQKRASRNGVDNPQST